MPLEHPALRYWVCGHLETRQHDWRVLSQTNDLSTARWLFTNARDQLWPIGVWLIDVETTTVLEESCGAPFDGIRPALRW